MSKMRMVLAATRLDATAWTSGCKGNSRENCGQTAWRGNDLSRIALFQVIQDAQRLGQYSRSEAAHVRSAEQVQQVSPTTESAQAVASVQMPTS